MADSETFALSLTPHGRLVLHPAVDDGFGLEPALASRLLVAFDGGSGRGLLQLGAGEVGTPLPGGLAAWRDFAGRYPTAVCTAPDLDDTATAVTVPPPSEADLATLVLSAPVIALAPSSIASRPSNRALIPGRSQTPSGMKVATMASRSPRLALTL